MNNLIEIDALRILCSKGNIKWSVHSLKRMRERSISSLDYKNSIMTGEIIEQYPNDRPLPSCLILGNNLADAKLHNVSATDNDYIYAITAYFPNRFEWEADFKTRKEQ